MIRPQTRSAGTSAIFEFWVCRCCVLHDDMSLAANRKVICPECGGLCSCPGCIADATEPGDG